MKTEDFDVLFDDGQDVAEYLDFTRATRPGQVNKRVNVDFPAWMVHSLDKEASRLGVPRQSLIKIMIAQQLERRQMH